MKNKITKIISAMLLIAFLVSTFAIFASAADDEESSELELLIHRTFDEGWDYNNGISPDSKIGLGDNKVYIDYERTSDDNYNYFLRLMTSGAEQGALNFSYGGGSMPTKGDSVVKISFKADDVTNISGSSIGAVPILTAKTNLDEQLKLIAIENGHLYAYNDKSGSSMTDLGFLGNSWIDLAFVFNFDKGGIYYDLYFGDNYSKKITVAYNYSQTGDIGVKSVQFLLPEAPSDAAAEAREGAGYCIDNFAVYNNSATILKKAELEALGQGIRFDTYVPKTIEILSSSGKTIEQSLAEALCMKLGVDYALFKNEKQPIFEKDGKVYGAPEKINGTVMVPLQLILDYIGFPSYVHADGMSYDITTGTSKTNLVAGRDSASVNGERIPLTVAPGFAGTGDNKYLVIALDDVETLFPGWLVTYDDMGLVIIYPDTTPDNSDDNTELVNRNDHLDLMVGLMKKFVFTTVTTDENGVPLKSSDSYIATGTMVYEDVKAYTNNFTHPYIGVNQAGFDKLYNAYKASAGTDDYNAKAKTYLEALVAKAEAFYKLVADTDDSAAYAGIKEDAVPVNVYRDGKEPDSSNPNAAKDTPDGYSQEGRLTEIVEYAEHLVDLAFAYQVTRNEKYALLAYDWAIALGQWEHWGPGFMSDCAEATYAYAIAYDWLYNAFYSLHGEDGVKAVAKILFEKGVHDGFVASSGRECEHPRNLGDSSAYSTLTTNANAVGAAGMIVGALALMEFDTLPANDTVATERTFVIGNNIIGLINSGLDVYAPDGSYSESATYWEKGTNALFRLVMSLVSATGKDYGFSDTWGIDKSCYYAIHIESSDGKIWNYNEAGADGVVTGAISGIDTQMFNFAAQFFGDATLAAVREKQLSSTSNAKEVSVYDMLFFPFDGIEDVELPLDYKMDGLDAFISRSDWESGALYTGIMGGDNSGNYTQLDSGNFIYHNKGIVWFMDLGSDNHASYQYFGASRYKYYRANAEGQNVVVITDHPTSIRYGQATNGSGELVKSFTNEHGSYAIVDNLSAYPTTTIVAANRGIFVTNDRRTVVIQDEMNFGTKVVSVAWVAHTAQNIELEAGGRVAYLTSRDASGKTYTLRATLVSKNKKAAFTVEDASKTFLTDTFLSDGSSSLGSAPEYSRDGIKKLVIEYKDAVNFNVAVVFELVNGKTDTSPVGYEWTSMSAWIPYADGTITDSDNSGVREGVNVEDIKTYTVEAEKYYKKGTAFTDNLAEFYLALTQVGYNFEILGLDIDLATYGSYVKKFNQLKSDYADFRASASTVIDNTFYFADVFSGVNEQEPEVETEGEGEGEGEETE